MKPETRLVMYRKIAKNSINILYSGDISLRSGLFLHSSGGYIALDGVGLIALDGSTIQ